MKTTRQRYSPRIRAFTLIELLVIISIIAVLASLTVGVAGLVARKSKISRTKADLAKLETAVRNYKSTYGFYPPDNLVDPANLISDPVLNPLFYELNGAVYDRSNDVYRVVGSDNVIGRVAYQAVFGRGPLGGIMNSSESVANVKPFLSESRPGAAEQIFSAPNVMALTAPVPARIGHRRANPLEPDFDSRFIPPMQPYDGPFNVVDPRANPWRYVSSNPTNNPGEFDLWAEIVLGDEIVVIGNWKDE